MHDELGLGEVGEIEMDMQTTVLGDIAMSIGSADLPENFEGKILVSRLDKYLPKSTFGQSTSEETHATQKFRCYYQRLMKWLLISTENRQFLMESGNQKVQKVTNCNN
ncbi:hypothetical protein POM88_052007 [Heracleum sosnowskyi]|uniref:Uncharacterized protein n=1 Tax=Heracleum sosnowskyi TaxID=360622 RepID=A0AAD8LZ22_9APIA|nr:hypothetical protein POM88_052007 [Heracleum sosnowskyi]